MGILGQITAIRDIFRLRRQVVAAEDKLGQTIAAPPGQKTTPSAPAIRHELATLLREQADLLEVSLLARMITMLPPPQRLRADADRLDDDSSWNAES